MNTLCTEDILSVANGLKMNLSQEEIDRTIDLYDQYEENYPDDTWVEIVEQILYNEIKNK